MSASEITEPRRVCLTLDPGLVLERLILKRLSGRKAKRGQDWLRSLLAQGFLAEGQWVRRDGKREGEPSLPAASAIPTTAFASWLQRTPTSRPLPAPAPRGAESVPLAIAEPPVTPVAVNTKPFAHLRKVIG